MMNKTKAFAKGGIATVAVGAMVLAGATPAIAGDGDSGISVGDVIAGAVVIGGVAALAGAFDNDRDDYRGDRYDNYRDRDGRYDRDGRHYNGDRWNSRGNPRSAVERCVNAARGEARRGGYRNAQVTDIRDVKDTRDGWRVKGRIAVDSRYNGGRYDRYGYYDRGNRYNRWDSSDAGSFTCYIERGRVADIDYKGIRGLG